MQQELPMNNPDNWNVRTRHFPQTKAQLARKEDPEVKHHELYFGRTLQLTKRGQDGLNILNEMAKFLNRRKLVPRERVECAADAPNLEKYLQKLAR